MTTINGEVPTGANIALVPDDPDAYTVPGGDPADALHVTMKFLGRDASEWSPDERAKVERVVAQWAAQAHPYAAAVTETGELGDEGAVVHHLEADDLQEHRARLSTMIDAYTEPDTTDTYPTFKPHMTVGYNLNGATPTTPVKPVRLGTVRVQWGEDVTDYPLGGAKTAAPRVRRRPHLDRPGVGRHDYHDPTTGKFAPLGYVSPSVLRGLLSSDMNDRINAEFAIRSKMDRPEAVEWIAEFRRSSGRDRQRIARNLRTEVIGERPGGTDAEARREQQAWGKASDVLASALARKSSGQVPDRPTPATEVPQPPPPPPRRERRIVDTPQPAPPPGWAMEDVEMFERPRADSPEGQIEELVAARRRAEQRALDLDEKPNRTPAEDAELQTAMAEAVDIEDRLLAQGRGPDGEMFDVKPPPPPDPNQWSMFDDDGTPKVPEAPRLEPTSPPDRSVDRMSNTDRESSDPNATNVTPEAPESPDTPPVKASRAKVREIDVNGTEHDLRYLKGDEDAGAPTWATRDKQFAARTDVDDPDSIYVDHRTDTRAIEIDGEVVGWVRNNGKAYADPSLPSNFDFVDMDGNTVSMEAFHRDEAVANYWATRAPKVDTPQPEPASPGGTGDAVRADAPEPRGDVAIATNVDGTPMVRVTDGGDGVEVWTESYRTTDRYDHAVEVDKWVKDGNSVYAIAWKVKKDGTLSSRSHENFDLPVPPAVQELFDNPPGDRTPDPDAPEPRGDIVDARPPSPPDPNQYDLFADPDTPDGVDVPDVPDDPEPDLDEIPDRPGISWVGTDGVVDPDGDRNALRLLAEARSDRQAVYDKLLAEQAAEAAAAPEAQRDTLEKRHKAIAAAWLDSNPKPTEADVSAAIEAGRAAQERTQATPDVGEPMGATVVTDRRKGTYLARLTGEHWDHGSPNRDYVDSGVRYKDRDGKMTATPLVPEDPGIYEFQYQRPSSKRGEAPTPVRERYIVAKGEPARLETEDDVDLLQQLREEADNPREFQSLVGERILGTRTAADQEPTPFVRNSPEPPRAEAVTRRSRSVRYAAVGAIRARTAELNERIKKKGLGDPVVVHVSEPYPVLSDGEEVLHVDVDVDVAAPPRLPGGWKLASVADWSATATPLVHNVGDDDLGLRPPDMDRHRCDHCGSRRLRNTVYVLRGEDGSTVHVGSTCIADFLGHDVESKLLSFPGILAEIEDDEFFEGGGGRPSMVPTDAFVAAAHAAVQKFGWSKSDSANPTRATTTELLFPRRKDREDTEFAAAIELANSPEALQFANEALEWARNMDPESDFDRNLQAVATSDDIGPKAFGIAAYLPVAYARHLDRDAELRQREQEIADKPTMPVPEGKQTVEGTVIGLKWQDNPYAYGESTLKMTVADDRGFRVWVTAPAAIAGDVERDSRVRFNATLSRSDDDDYFGFGKRPSKAELLDAPDSAPEEVLDEPLPAPPPSLYDGQGDLFDVDWAQPTGEPDFDGDSGLVDPPTDPAPEVRHVEPADVDPADGLALATDYGFDGDLIDQWRAYELVHRSGGVDTAEVAAAAFGDDKRKAHRVLQRVAGRSIDSFDVGGSRDRRSRYTSRHLATYQWQSLGDEGDLTTDALFARFLDEKGLPPEPLRVDDSDVPDSPGIDAPKPPADLIPAKGTRWVRVEYGYDSPLLGGGRRHPAVVDKEGNHYHQAWEVTSKRGDRVYLRPADSDQKSMAFTLIPEEAERGSRWSNPVPAFHDAFRAAPDDEHTKYRTPNFAELGISQSGEPSPASPEVDLFGDRELDFEQQGFDFDAAEPPEPDTPDTTPETPETPEVVPETAPEPDVPETPEPDFPGPDVNPADLDDEALTARRLDIIDRINSQNTANPDPADMADLAAVLDEEADRLDAAGDTAGAARKRQAANQWWGRVGGRPEPTETPEPDMEPDVEPRLNSEGQGIADQAETLGLDVQVTRDGFTTTVTIDAGAPGRLEVHYVDDRAGGRVRRSGAEAVIADRNGANARRESPTSAADIHRIIRILAATGDTEPGDGPSPQVVTHPFDNKGFDKFRDHGEPRDTGWTVDGRRVLAYADAERAKSLAAGRSGYGQELWVTEDGEVVGRLAYTSGNEPRFDQLTEIGGAKGTIPKFAKGKRSDNPEELFDAREWTPSPHVELEPDATVRLGGMRRDQQTEYPANVASEVQVGDTIIGNDRQSREVVEIKEMVTGEVAFYTLNSDGRRSKKPIMARGRDSLVAAQRDGQFLRDYDPDKAARDAEEADERERRLTEYREELRQMAVDANVAPELMDRWLAYHTVWGEGSYGGMTTREVAMDYGGSVDAARRELTKLREDGLVDSADTQGWEEGLTDSEGRKATLVWIPPAMDEIQDWSDTRILNQFLRDHGQPTVEPAEGDPPFEEWDDFIGVGGARGSGSTLAAPDLPEAPEAVSDTMNSNVAMHATQVQTGDGTTYLPRGGFDALEGTGYRTDGGYRTPVMAAVNIDDPDSTRDVYWEVRQTSPGQARISIHDADSDLELGATSAPIMSPEGRFQLARLSGQAAVEDDGRTQALLAAIDRDDPTLAKGTIPRQALDQAVEAAGYDLAPSARGKFADWARSMDATVGAVSADSIVFDTPRYGSIMVTHTPGGSQVQAFDRDGNLVHAVDRVPMDDFTAAIAPRADVRVPEAAVVILADARATVNGSASTDDKVTAMAAHRNDLVATLEQIAPPTDWHQHPGIVRAVRDFGTEVRRLSERVEVGEAVGETAAAQELSKAEVDARKEWDGFLRDSLRDTDLTATLGEWGITNVDELVDAISDGDWARADEYGTSVSNMVRQRIDLTGPGGGRDGRAIVVTVYGSNGFDQNATVSVYGLRSADTGGGRIADNIEREIDGDAGWKRAKKLRTKVRKADQAAGKARMADKSTEVNATGRTQRQNAEAVWAVLNQFDEYGLSPDAARRIRAGSGRKAVPRGRLNRGELAARMSEAKPVRGGGKQSKDAQLVELGLSYYPQSWVDSLDDHTFLVTRRTGQAAVRGGGHNINLGGDRVGYPNSSLMSIPGDDSRSDTIVHEVGHTIERQVPGLMDMVIAHLDQLHDPTDNVKALSGFRSTYGYEDDIKRTYAQRVYSKGYFGDPSGPWERQRNKGLSATEYLTVGMEGLVPNNPDTDQVFGIDTVHDDFILGLLATYTPTGRGTTVVEGGTGRVTVGGEPQPAPAPGEELIPGGDVPAPA